MGNYVCSTVACHRPSNTCGAAGKVILWDGSVQEFSWPLTAAELMLEHPQHIVAELHAEVYEKRPIPLPADQKLDVKKVYVMLPLKRGGKPTALSSEEARRVLLSANSVLRKSKSMLLPPSKVLPWFARICPTVNVEETGQRFPASQKKDNGGGERREEVRCLTEFLPESVELGRPEYLNRQISGKGTWKPSLDTIKEKKVEKKVPHWLF